MSFSQKLLALFDTNVPARGPRDLRVRLATSRADIREAQRLRHRVFAQEMGAQCDGEEPGLDTDRFDAFCQHLLVVDQADGRVVGCYRVLTDAHAAAAGGFYSQGEFDLTRILALPGRFMEVGRTCVDPDYRSGATIALLWNGLARMMTMNNVDYLMGCASIPLGSGTANAAAIYAKLKEKYLAPESWRTFPKTPLPDVNLAGARESARIPPLVNAYLRMGAKICGDPAWDRKFNVADLFILLDANRINRRYTRRFVARA